jgi:polysaccharide biosynthesis protein PslF
MPKTLTNFRQPLQRPLRPMFVSTIPPEECGLATFTRDTADAFDEDAGCTTSELMAIRRNDATRYEDTRVRHVIDGRDRLAFRRAGEAASRSDCDVVSIQHEFGLYCGPWGDAVLDLALACRKPLATTFHTLMADPPDMARAIIRHLAALSRGVVVMTRAAAALLVTDFRVPASKVHVIPHGVPSVPPRGESQCKRRLGLEDRRVLCTFGLIGRGKGLEHVIEAMPAIVRQFPNALYRIIGVTHPLVKRDEGEAYRESLQRMAAELGVGSHVSFVNQFLELPELLTHLQACDVYVTPYPNKSQIASGTLAYAMAAGRAIVSTRYIHAEEVLEEGRGVLVSSAAGPELAAACIRLLQDDSLRAEIGRRAHTYSIPMRWPQVARSYHELFAHIAWGRSPIEASGVEHAEVRHTELSTGVP